MNCLQFLLVLVVDAGLGCKRGNLEAKVGKQLSQQGNQNQPKDSEVLLIGPGLGSDGKSEVRSLPDLSPLDCNLPVFPDGSYWGYVGRYTSGGVQMCGGQTSKEYVTSSCYLLTSSGYKPMQGLLNPRKGAASIETPLGWWVTGGYDDYTRLDSTELWSNKESPVRLPYGRMEGHCLVNVSQSEILLTGGSTGNYLPNTYLYNTDLGGRLRETEGFSRIGDMKTPRRYHGCSVINDSVVFVAGGEGSGRETEYLDLATLTWVPGPELPVSVGPAQMIGSLLIGRSKIFKLEELGTSTDRQWQWVEKVEKLKNYRRWQRSFVVSKDFCV